jgi:hypothetical protein
MPLTASNCSIVAEFRSAFMAAMAPETGRNKPNDRHAARIRVVRGLKLNFIKNAPFSLVRLKKRVAGVGCVGNSVRRRRALKIMKET